MFLVDAFCFRFRSSTPFYPVHTFPGGLVRDFMINDRRGVIPSDLATVKRLLHRCHPMGLGQMLVWNPLKLRDELPDKFTLRILIQHLLDW